MQSVAEILKNEEMTMELSEVAQVLGSHITGDDCEFDGIAIDSRSLVRGDLYVALKGEHFDGHDFVSHAADQGACAVVVEHEVDCGLPAVVVSDTRLALGELAKHIRRGFHGPLIGLTGSNGKTTVKEMLAAILHEKGQVLATRGNFNNDIGVPLTLFRLKPFHDYAVIEMGANHAGEIAYLTGLASPSVALITNAAPAHLEGFGSLDGVANAKGEIFQGLVKGGVAIINQDDKYSDLWKACAKEHSIVTFGTNGSADVHATWQEGVDGSEIDLHAPEGSVHFSLAMPGKHNVMNALAASAAALAAGISLEEVKRGLESTLIVPGRSQRKSGLNGAVVIDDTYNANPASLGVALDVLAVCEGARLFVMGDMAELGDETLQLHRDAGKKVFASGVEAFFAIGDLSRVAVEEYTAAGGKNGFHFDTQDALVDAVTGRLHQGVTVLVKGSRSMRMERIVIALTEAGGS